MAICQRSAREPRPARPYNTTMNSSHRQRAVTPRAVCLAAALSLFAALLVAAPARAITIRATAVPYFKTVHCWFDPPEGRKATCGWMHVPENWRRKDSRLIRFGVVIFRSDAAVHRTDPVVVVGGGGPGSPVGIDGDGPNDWWDFLDTLALSGGRDVVVMEQRGTGMADPVLDCPELREGVKGLLGHLSSARTYARQVGDEARRCRERLAESGVDVTGYDSADTAADIDALRRALGYKRWNLYGTSYAARVALTVMRDFPGGVRSAILDSPEPPEAKFYEESSAAVARAFRALFADCAANKACNTAYPKIAATFARVVHRLNKHPITITIAWPDTLAPFSMPVDGERLIEILYQALYDPSRAGRVPLLVTALDRGSSDLLAPLARDVVKQYVSEDWSDGLYYSTMCREEMPYNDMRVALANSRKYPLYRGFDDRWLLSEMAACKAWDAGTAAPIEGKAVRTSIPALVLNGGLDPVTPPAWGRGAARHIKPSWYHEFRTDSHDVLSLDTCAQDVAAVFLDEPRADPFDMACMSHPAKQSFDLDR